MNRKLCLFLSILVIGSVVLNIVTLKEGQNWGGDFSEYIINAQNLLNGREYNQGIFLGRPTIVYPPGFSFILAPLVKFFGVNFKILKIPNIFFWYVYVWAMYFLFKKRLGEETALLGLSFLCLSSYFFFTKQWIISDISFVSVLTLALLTFDVYEQRLKDGLKVQSRVLFFLFVILACFCIFIRSIGVVLFISGIVYLGGVKKERTLALGLLLALLVMLNIINTYTGLHPGELSSFIESPLHAFRNIFRGHHLPLRALAWVFCPDGTRFTAFFFSVFQNAARIFGWLFYGTVLFLFIRRLWKRQISLWGIFFCLYLAVLTLWSGFIDQADIFARLSLPLLGPTIIFLIQGGISLSKRLARLKFNPTIAKWTVRILFGFLIILNLINIGWRFDFNDDVLFQKDNQELFSWVKNNVQSNEHLMFWRPQPMKLMTQRLGNPPPGQVFDRALWQDAIFSAAISYVILSKQWETSGIDGLKKAPDLAVVVWENAKWIVFRIRANYVFSPT